MTPLLALLAVLAAQPSAATRAQETRVEPLEDAAYPEVQRAIAQRDFALASRELRPLAEQLVGDAERRFMGVLDELARNWNPQTPAQGRALLRSTLAPPTCRKLRLPPELLREALQKLRAVDPEAQAFFSRPVKVTLEAPGFSKLQADLALDRAISGLKALAIPASHQGDGDVLALQAGKVRSDATDFGGGATVHTARINATGRWLSKGEVLLGGMDLVAGTRGLNGPLGLDDGLAAGLGDAVGPELVRRWSAEHP